LYLEGKGRPRSENTKFTWMGKGKFYTLTSATKKSDQLLFTRLGANDPRFNLRRDAALMIRRQEAKNTVFASVIEAHGSYSPVSEMSANADSSVSSLTVLYDSLDFTAVEVSDVSGQASILIVSNRDSSKDAEHRLKVGEAVYQWTGPYYFRDNQ